MKRLIVVTILALVFGLTLQASLGSAPDYPAPGFTADPNPPAWDTGRPGITWAFVPGKGYAWFENDAMRVAGAQPVQLRAVPRPIAPQRPQQPAPCPTCPNGQCPIPRRV